MSRSSLRRFGMAYRCMLGVWGAILAITTGGPSGCTTGAGFRDTFLVNKSELRSTGVNTFFSLQPGTQSTLAGAGATVTITVLDETRVVDGVETRVVEEREEEGGQLVEVSRNYFAIDPATNDVYYFGEEVDIYENGQIVGHDGAWLSGVDGARFGLIMPGEIIIGDQYYQEIAPDVAMDRAENISIDETVETPAGTFTGCLHVVETTPLESGESLKWYCPSVGLVQDGDVVLTNRQTR